MDSRDEKVNTAVSTFPNQTILDHCPACGSDRIGRHVVGEDYHYGNRGRYSTDLCDSCGSAFMNPMPSATDLSAFYPSEYYSFQPPSPQPKLKLFLKKLLQFPHVYTIPKFSRPGKMLDIGCGAGHYLLEMRQRGWEVFGAELSPSAADAGRRAGLDIRTGELAEAGFETGAFDFVRSNHSFEHIPTPDDTLVEIRRVLNDEGKLFIGVPRFDGLFARLFGKYWWNFAVPVHTHNYTTAGITATLERNGFQVERVVQSSDYAGLIGSLQIYLNARKGKQDSDGWLVRNPVAIILSHSVAKILDLFRQGDCIEIIAVKR